MKENIFYAATYIRLSREDGDKAESDSIANQKKLLADYLKGRDEFILYDTYVDDGFTGTDFKRPAFQRMLRDIEAGAVNCVIVKDLSRFGRDYIDAGKYLERDFPDRGVRFISVTDNIDSLRQAYDLLLPMKNILNEQYARDISEKVHASIRTKQKAGEFIGAFASYGYQKSSTDKNKLIIDEYAADIVRRIFQMYISGLGKNRIAAELNREGIVCPSEYKKRNGEHYRNSRRLESTSYWTYSTIHRLLQNEMYIGNMVQGRKSQRMRSRQRSVAREDWIVVRGTHEAIIDRDTWETAQNLLVRRTRENPAAHGQTALAGFLKCGDCGRAMVKKTYASGRSGKGEKVHARYFCGTYTRCGRQYCTSHAVSQEALEAILLQDFQTILQNVNKLEKIAREVCDTVVRERPRTEQEEERMETELIRLRRLKKAVYEDYREGLISREEFDAYRKEYLEREEMLSRRKEELAEMRDGKTVASLWEMPWLKRLLAQRGIEKPEREMAVEMLYEIKIYEDHRIQIIYNFTDELAALFSSVYMHTGS